MSRVTNEQIAAWRRLVNDQCDCGQCHVCTLRMALDALEYERHWSDKFERRCNEAEAAWLEDRKARVAAEAKLARIWEEANEGAFEDDTTQWLRSVLDAD